METNIRRIYAGTVDNTKVQVINEGSCVVVKTLMLGNNTDAEQTVDITIDGAVFKFKVSSLNTVILNNPIVCNTMQVVATGAVSLQISGIAL